jgi:hypothetical protein
MGLLWWLLTMIADKLPFILSPAEQIACILADTELLVALVLISVGLGGCGILWLGWRTWIFCKEWRDKPPF